MARNFKTLIVSSVALAIGLAGCAGDGTSTASIPAPPPAPTPTPPPTPSAASIGAPTRAIVPNASLFPEAAAGGPTIQSHSSTVFPLLETVVKINSAGAVADTTTMNAGASLQFSSAPDDYRIDIGNPAVGISNQPLELDWCGYCASVGNEHVSMHIVDPATSNLSWTTYGTWGVHIDVGAPSTTSAAFVTGYKTPSGSLPSTGTATYLGSVVGTVIHPAAGQENGVATADLSGNATLQANFASASVAGNLTNMMAGSLPWNSVSLLGTIAGGQFTGTSAATSAPANAMSLNSSATGTFSGVFFGPSAQELGAVWTLYDGTSSAVGSIGATTNPSGAGKWDY